MNKLESNKNSVAEHLRALTIGAPLLNALAAIEGLGELGGPSAVRHIEELMNEGMSQGSGEGREKWISLIRAYGRAARYLPENE